ncbi:unnamed protein product [Lymnaea stagnalis]|uniref:Uncharacterized protein n=1 Tax=Lymnaea stagnalis TaxID=6523 RepID=A0AAV2I289_LYMST
MYYHIPQASVAVFILVLCASLSSTVPQYDGEVTPTDPFLFEGETLNLSCRLKDTSNKNITLYFKYQRIDSGDNNCQQITSEQNKRNLTEFTIRTSESDIGLVVPNVSISDSGHYCCVRHQNDSCSVRIDKQIVTVEHDLKKVTNFRCIVQDWLEMNCTWTHSVKYSCPHLLKVNLTYSSPNESTPRLCPSQVISSCLWKQDFINDNYTMILTVWHEKRGDRTEESNFTIYTWHHVRPNRVKELTVEPLSSTCVKLRWDRNTTRSDSDLMFIIRYRNSKNWQKVNESLNFTDNFVSTTQCHLQPYTNYTFRVWVRPNKKGNRSEPVEAHNQTLEDLPTEAPETCLGCFHPSQCRETMPQRCVTVYWRDIPEEHKHGHITYDVQLNDMMTLSTNETCITFSGVNTSSSDFRAVITPSTKAGKALKNTTVLMFDERPDPPEDLVVEVLDKEYFISWKDSKRNTALERNITIVWCYRRPPDKECETPINWIDVATPTPNYTLSPDGNTSHPIKHLDIRIGISATVKSAGEVGRRSSGIHWSPCIYHYDQRPSTAPIVSLTEGTTVSWEIEQCPNAYITGYSITHCQTSDGRTCKGLKDSVRVNNSVKMYHIQNISRDTKYLVYIEAWSRNGSSPSSNSINLRNTTTIHLHAIYTGDYSLHSITGVLTYLILVALVILGIWLCCKSKLKFAAMYKAESDVMCCSPRVKNQSKNGTSFKSSDSETPLLDEDVTTTKNNTSLPIHSKDKFKISNVSTGNKSPTRDKEENVALLNKIHGNGQAHPTSTEGSIPIITEAITKLVDIDKMSVDHNSPGEDVDRLHAGDDKEMSGRPQTRCAQPLLSSCQTSNKSNDLYIRVSDVSAVSGRDVRHNMKMIGDCGHDRHSHASTIEDSGHDIQNYVQMTKNSGHDPHSGVSVIGNSGQDTHIHVSSIADSVHDIHKHVSATGESVHDIQSYVQITGDSRHDITNHMSAIADNRHDNHNHVSDTEDSGNETHIHVSETEDSGHETQNSDTSNEYSQRTIEDNASRVPMTTEKNLQNVSPSNGVNESPKDTYCTTSASTVASEGHLEYVRINILEPSNT